MPSKSPEQARLMRAVAHGWKKPGGGGPTRAVAREFTESDRRTKVQGYNRGGMTGRVMGPLSRDPRAMGVAGPQRLQMGPQRGAGAGGSMPYRGVNPRQQITRGGQLPRGGQMPYRGVDPRQHITRGGQPPRGGLRQMSDAMGGSQDPKQMRRVAPPPGKRVAGSGGYPGGGNPMTGGRNPMMRQANQYRPFMGGGGRGMRGATSFLR